MNNDEPILTTKTLNEEQLKILRYFNAAMNIYCINMDILATSDQTDQEKYILNYKKALASYGAAMFLLNLAIETTDINEKAKKAEKLLERGSIVFGLS